MALPSRLFQMSVGDQGASRLGTRCLRVDFSLGAVYFRVVFPVSSEPKTNGLSDTPIPYPQDPQIAMVKPEPAAAHRLRCPDWEQRLKPVTPLDTYFTR